MTVSIPSGSRTSTLNLRVILSGLVDSIESTNALIDIIKILNEFPNAKFTVEGHTDSIGTVVNNQKLSESRAAAVKNFLIEKGIDSSRLSSIGYGESKPIATNMYKDGRAQNRRVEINLIK